jgi:hypothetical protein
MSSPEVRADLSWLEPAIDHYDISRSKSPRTISSATGADQSPKEAQIPYEPVLQQVEDTTVEELNTKRTAKAVLLHVVITLAVTSTIGGLLFIAIGPTGLVNPPGSCRPDGNFRYYGHYDPWAPPGILQITISFGPMSFSNAKLIDVIWDVVVGRGGQLWPVFVSTNYADLF